MRAVVFLQPRQVVVSASSSLHSPLIIKDKFHNPLTAPTMTNSRSQCLVQITLGYSNRQCIVNRSNWKTCQTIHWVTITTSLHLSTQTQLTHQEPQTKCSQHDALRYWSKLVATSHSCCYTGTKDTSKLWVVHLTWKRLFCLNSYIEETGPVLLVTGLIFLQIHAWAPSL